MKKVVGFNKNKDKKVGTKETKSAIPEELANISILNTLNEMKKKE